MLSLHCPPRLLEDRLDCARHNSTAADPEDRKVSIPKILMASIITKEHEAGGMDEELPINFSAHYSPPSVIALGGAAGACQLAAVVGLESVASRIPRRGRCRVMGECLGQPRPSRGRPCAWARVTHSGPFLAASPMVPWQASGEAWSAERPVILGFPWDGAVN